MMKTKKKCTATREVSFIISFQRNILLLKLDLILYVFNFDSIAVCQVFYHGYHWCSPYTLKRTSEYELKKQRVTRYLSTARRDTLTHLWTSVDEMPRTLTSSPRYFSGQCSISWKHNGWFWMEINLVRGNEKVQYFQCYGETADHQCYRVQLNCLTIYCIDQTEDPGRKEGEVFVFL